MAINQDAHKAVFVIADNYMAALGFPSIAEAIKAVEYQVPEADAMNAIEEAISSEGTLINGTKVQIMDIESYLDITEESDEDDE
jgi:hypothetical protein